MNNDIKSMTLPELSEALTGLGLPSFRAKQVFRWLHVDGVSSFDDMTNISKELRTRLASEFVIRGVKIEKRLVSQSDGSVKYLFSLVDGELIESVFMRHDYGITLCISTQVGCRMGCRFCASTLSGRIRDLTPSEMLSQLHAAQNDNGERISHVVLMGCGEPLDNYDNTMRFLQLVTCPDGLNLGMRHISLSTCGLVDRIYQLSREKLQLTLSVSLHAPNDRIRAEMMPISKKWSIDELLRACRKYSEITKRRISFEYAMVSGVNDSDECAFELSRKLKGMLCHVNLIPVNEINERDFKRSDNRRLSQFQHILTDAGINTTVRLSRGGDINASCGQLRAAETKG